MKPLLPRILTIALALPVAVGIQAQGPDPESPRKHRPRYVIWPVPSLASHIHGIAVGPIGSEHICSREAPQVSNGINAQFIGAGIFLVIGVKQLGLRKQLKELRVSGSSTVPDSLLVRGPFAVTHNGVLVSPLGTITPRVNGVSVNGLASSHRVLNGVAINGLWNLVLDQRGVAAGLFNSGYRTRGLQVGLVNRTHELRGLQIGLWNRNAKRALPIVNWGSGK